MRVTVANAVTALLMACCQIRHRRRACTGWRMQAPLRSTWWFVRTGLPIRICFRIVRSIRFSAVVPAIHA